MTLRNTFATTTLVALSLLSAAACSKSSSSPTGSSPASATTNVSVNGSVATREEEGVTRYGDEGPESGTVVTRKQLSIHKSADQGSDVLGRLGPGTGVNKKARHGAYYLIEWPSAQGMKPGWVLQDEITGGPVVPTVVPPTVVAPPTTPPVGAAGAPGGRPPPIKITHLVLVTVRPGSISRPVP